MKLTRTIAFSLGLTAGAILAVPATAQIVTECLVQADEIGRIGAASRGVLVELHVSRADHVTEGQILAELEASEEDVQVELAQLRVASDIALRLAQARAETAELNAERLRKLSARDRIPKSELEAALLEAASAQLDEEEAQFQRRVAEVQLKAALSARERKRIRAPFDGVITETLLTVGELYNEQSPVLVIARVDPLDVDAYLPAGRRADVSIGQTLQISLETGGVVSAEVSVIDPVLDAATGTFGVQLTLPNPDGDILAGQSCALDIEPLN